jgi:hypothetical protein
MSQVRYGTRNQNGGSTERLMDSTLTRKRVPIRRGKITANERPNRLRPAGERKIIKVFNHGKNNHSFTPSRLFPIFADMLNKHCVSKELENNVMEMEDMFSGVSTSEELINKIGMEKALRILSMYVMTNGKFRKAYNNTSSNRRSNFQLF